MTGFIIVFKIEQAQIRKNIKQQLKAGIPDDKLHFFGLSRTEYAELDWVRQDKEFRMGKEMFDVVRSETFDDSIHLHCVNDTEETQLFAHLEEIIQKKREQQSNVPKSPISKVVKALKLVYVPNTFANAIDIYDLKLSSLFAEMNASYASPYLKVLTPPPDTV